MSRTNQDVFNAPSSRRQMLAGLAITIAASSLFAGCAGIPAGAEVIPPEVTLADLRPVGAGLLEQRYEAVLRLRNPNDFDVPLSGLRYDLNLNGQPFGSGSTSESVTIPRLGETTISVESSTNIVQIITQLGALRQGGLEYALSGDAFLSGSERRAVAFDTGGRLF